MDIDDAFRMEAALWRRIKPECQRVHTNRARRERRRRDKLRQLESKEWQAKVEADEEQSKTEFCFWLGRESELYNRASPLRYSDQWED